jgi:lipopolysaccharide export system permease protein
VVIGVAMASRKVKGGLGLHLGLGLLLTFTYIMFQQVTKTFALSGAITPLLAMWLPNILYAIIGYFLYKWAAR